MTENLTLFEHGLNFIPDKIYQAATSDITGNWIPMKIWKRLYLLIIKGDGTQGAGDDPLITFNEATDSSGTGSQALAQVSKVWWRISSTDDTAWTNAWGYEKLATPLSTIDFTPTTGSLSTDIASDENSALLLFEIMDEQLTDGYTHVQAVSAGSAIAGAGTEMSFIWIGSGGKFPRNVPVDE
jgi:hypothetical protein